MSTRTMKAVRLSEYGQPEVLQYVDVPLPEVATGEVLVRVRATSATDSFCSTENISRLTT